VKRAAATAGVLAAMALPFATISRGDAEVRWRQLVSVTGAVDVAGPRADGRFVVASRQGLFLLRRNGKTTPFARGPGGYVPPIGEPYAAVARTRRVPGAGCAFRGDDVYALEPTSTPGVTLVRRTGRARRFMDLPAGSFPSSIAFDGVGRFGYRLLVTALVSDRTTLYAFDCRGRARVVTRGALKVEGGAAVAPLTFRPFGGQLIAADEFSGRIYAFSATGRVSVVVRPNLSVGRDLGVESVGFVPRGFTRRGAAFLADTGAPGSPTEGTDTVLTLSGAQLDRTRVRPGDLLVATEARGVTVDVRCARRCSVRGIGRAFDATHGEGHIAFAVG
jgi:hypothetical protein